MKKISYIFKLKQLNNDKGISIILAIIIIIVLGLAGSIFAYLMSSGSINSRADLLSAEAKYAAKSGVELTLYELEKTPPNLAPPYNTPPGCPTKYVLPPGPTVKNSTKKGYLSGNLQGYLSPSVNFTPTFCAMITTVTITFTPNCNGGKFYIINSNGFAGGTEREITAEVGISNGNGNNCTGIYVETELPNSQQ
jgi:hypothetical protein